MLASKECNFPLLYSHHAFYTRLGMASDRFPAAPFSCIDATTRSRRTTLPTRLYIRPPILGPASQRHHQHNSYTGFVSPDTTIVFCLALSLISESASNLCLFRDDEHDYLYATRP